MLTSRSFCSLIIIIDQKVGWIAKQKTLKKEMLKRAEKLVK